MRRGNGFSKDVFCLAGFDSGDYAGTDANCPNPNLTTGNLFPAARKQPFPL
jgi:hypothetical protein